MQRIPRKVVGIPQAEMAAFHSAPGAGSVADGQPPRMPAPERGRSGGGRRTHAPPEDDVRFHRGLPLSKRTPGRARVSAAAPGVFTGRQIDELVEFFDANGYATLRGVFDESAVLDMEAELVGAQRRLVDAELDPRHATDILDNPGATIGGRPFAHYVCYATDASALADRAVHHQALVEVAQRLLGPTAWLLDYEQFGVVYQDARPDPGSGYSRIGWHTDHQSAPHLGISPGFERVPGEIALYAERGDVLFHHADLWHAAARGTADGPAAIRRHLRGSWYGGTKLAVGHGTDDFVKNALR